MDKSLIDQRITSAVNAITAQHSFIEIFSDEFPDLTFNASDPVVADLYDCITHLNSPSLEVGGHKIYRQLDNVGLSGEAKNDSKVYVIENNRFCIVLLGDNEKVQYYQRFPLTEVST